MVANGTVVEIADVAIRPLGGRTGAALLKFKRAPTPELVVSGSGTLGRALAQIRREFAGLSVWQAQKKR